jgi:hypothetical protein
MIAELIRRGRELADEGDTRTDNDLALEYIDGWVSDGRTLLELAESLSAATGLDIYRHAVSKWVAEVAPGGDEGAALTRARARGAHALAEQAIMTAGNAPAERDFIALSKLRIDTNLRVAEVWNRAEFGKQQPGASVSISLNVAHLTALRDRPTATVHLEGSSVTTDENGVRELAAGEEEALVLDEVDAPKC